MNHENILNRSNMSLENAFSSQSSIRHGRGRGRANSRGRGRSSTRGGCSSSPGNIGGRGQNPNNNQPSNQKFDKSKIQFHYYKSMDIMHMNAERDSIIRTSKVKIS